jgi:hypothetical protein
VISAFGWHCDLHIVRLPLIVEHTIRSMNESGVNFADGDVCVEFNVFLPTQKEIAIFQIRFIVVLFPKLRCPLL